MITLTETIITPIITLSLIICIMCVFYMVIKFILKDVDNKINQNDKNTKNKN